MISAPTIYAHGLGGSTDLPIPVSYALVGGAWALTASFAILLFAWRTPRLSRDRVWRRLPDTVSHTIDSPWTRTAISVVAVAFTVWVAVLAFARPADASNPLPGVFYVLLWVGLVPVSLVFGPVWRIVSPVRAAHRLLCAAVRRDPDRGFVTMPDSVGVVPAAAGLFAFVWFELVSPDPASVSGVRAWCTVYVAVTIVGGVLFGSGFFARCDPFEVYSDTMSRLSPLARDAPSRKLVLRNPLNGVSTYPVRRGSVAVVAILLGSTAYDSFSQAPVWRNAVDDVSSGGGRLLVRTAGLAAFVAVVALTFWFAARATGGVTRVERAKLPGRLAHSLVPIIVGYVFAHYLTYLVEKGQQTIILLFGLDAQVSYVLSEHPTVVATVTVLCVLIGHIVGVTAAHDASLTLLPRGHRSTGQLTLMVTMVLYTFGGLFLLFGA